MKTNQGFTTKIVHSDRMDHPEHGSVHKPIHTSVLFGYDPVEGLVNVFQNKASGYAYSRQASPTVTALENKVTKMEDGVGTVVFGTGMAAITAVFLALITQKDHVIASSFLFGNTRNILDTFKGMGIDIDFVDVTKVENVKKVTKPNTKLVLVETVANPVTQVADLKSIGQYCKEKNIIYFVDNTITTPYLFRPKEVYASLVMNSLSKYIGGHGNALGGSITDTGIYDWNTFENIYENIRQSTEVQKQALVQIRKRGLRDGGGTLAPEASHTLSMGSETLALRMGAICASAMKVALFLENHPKIKRVNYPGLASHPQHHIAKELFKNYSGLMSFELVDGIDCLKFLNHLKLVIKSSHLGDNRTLAIPIAHTIFFELGKEKRKEMGIDESLIRLSVGIEDTDDILDDLDKALELC